MSEEELHQEASVADEVVAAYVAYAVRSVSGVAGLRSSVWHGRGHKSSGLSTEGVVVRMLDSSSVEVGVHLTVAWGAVIPDVAHEVQDLVQRRLKALLDLEVAAVVVHVDEVEAPPHFC